MRKKAKILNCVFKASNINPVVLFSGDYFRYIDIASIDSEKKIIVKAQKLKGSEAPSRARQILEEGDIIVSTVRPNLNAVAYVTKEYHGSIGSTGFCVLRADEKILNPKYLYYWVRSSYFIADMVKKATGASYPAVSDSIVKDSEIPLPSLHNQQQIADTLDKADALSQIDQQLLQKYDELSQTVFHEMFGDPIENSCRFKKTPLKEVVKIKGGKRLPKGAAFSQTATNHPYIRVTDFERMSVNTDSIKYLMSDIQNKISRYTISSQDVYISIAGTIGLCGIVPPHLNGANLTENAAKLVINNVNELKPEYLAAFLMTTYGQGEIEKRKMAVGVPKLALFRIGEIEVIVPPISDQQEYIKKTNQINQMRSKAEKQYILSAKLFQSLLTDLLK